jgi:hypothetical protein
MSLQHFQGSVYAWQTFIKAQAPVLEPEPVSFLAWVRQLIAAYRLKT